MNEQPTHLDLFSGIGAFSLAFESEGFKTVGFSEIDPFAAAVLKKNWPHVTNCGDFRNCPIEQVAVITAGVPCQPASCAGRRRGTFDPRWLWDETIELVCRIRPQFALFENVTALLKLNDGSAFNGILSKLAAGGYDCWWTCIPACAIGAPHERDRVWIVAYSPSERQQWRWQPSMRSSLAARPETPQWLSDTSPFIRPLGIIPRKKIARILALDDGDRRSAYEIKLAGNSIVPQVAKIFAAGIAETLMVHHEK